MTMECMRSSCFAFLRYQGFYGKSISEAVQDLLYRDQTRVGDSRQDFAYVASIHPGLSGQFPRTALRIGYIPECKHQSRSIPIFGVILESDFEICPSSLRVPQKITMMFLEGNGCSHSVRSL